MMFITVVSIVLMMRVLQLAAPAAAVVDDDDVHHCEIKSSPTAPSPSCSNGCYYNYNINECIPVGPGYYSPGNDASRYQCYPGTYSSSYGSRRCSYCSSGSYSSSSGATSCFPCNNTYYDGIGSDYALYIDDNYDDVYDNYNEEEEEEEEEAATVPFCLKPEYPIDIVNPTNEPSMMPSEVTTTELPSTAPSISSIPPTVSTSLLPTTTTTTTTTANPISVSDDNLYISSQPTAAPTPGTTTPTAVNIDSVPPTITLTTFLPTTLEPTTAAFPQEDSNNSGEEDDDEDDLDSSGGGDASAGIGTEEIHHKELRAKVTRQYLPLLVAIVVFGMLAIVIQRKKQRKQQRLHDSTRKKRQLRRRRPPPPPPQPALPLPLADENGDDGRDESVSSSVHDIYVEDDDLDGSNVDDDDDDDDDHKMQAMEQATKGLDNDNINDDNANADNENDDGNNNNDESVWSVPAANSLLEHDQEDEGATVPENNLAP